MACSAKSKSAESLNADQSTPTSKEESKQEKCATEILNKSSKNEVELPNVCGTTGTTTKGEGDAGVTGKRKKSRWDFSQADEQNVNDVATMTKRKRTRWDNNDDHSKLRMLGPINLPDLVGSSEDPKVKEMKKQLSSINKNLQNPFSLAGKNEVALIHQKQTIIKQLIDNNPTFCCTSKPDQQKFCKKLYVPVKEYPHYNFIGLIIGPQGRTLQRMEKSTGATIRLRGKGSVKGSKPKDDSEEEDLHVFLEASSQKSLDAAAEMIEALLVPLEDAKNQLKLSQLRELAVLNGSLRDENSHRRLEMPLKSSNNCEICGDVGHYSVACPLKPSTVPRVDEGRSVGNVVGNVDFSATGLFSGTSLQTKAHGNDVNFCNTIEYPSILGNQPQVHSMTFSDKLIRDLQYTNLCITHLPQHVDVDRLTQLFSPFGALSRVQVIRDQTTGLSTGYGFVEYFNYASGLMAANQMNGYTLDGKKLTVQLASNEHCIPVAMQPTKHMDVCFPPIYPTSITTTNVPPPHWPGLSERNLPVSYTQQMPHGSLFVSAIPSSQISLNPTPEELAQFPGNPDKLSGNSSLFS